MLPPSDTGANSASDRRSRYQSGVICFLTPPISAASFLAPRFWEDVENEISGGGGGEGKPRPEAPSSAGG